LQIPPLHQNPQTTPVPQSVQSPSPQCLNQCGTGCQQSCLQRNPQPQEGCNRSCANTCNYVCASSPLSQMTATDVSIYPVRLDPRERCSSECQSVCQIVCRTQLTARKCFDSCAPQCERVCEEPVDFSQQSTVRLCPCTVT
uniref:Cysteine rich repeat-containing domain protein n=1 Tax=Angiostrongylus costaricensis TaxID=334426 RepID=A0A0R3PFK2_ANGCS